jgi:hypothetical protein
VGGGTKQVTGTWRHQAVDRIIAANPDQVMVVANLRLRSWFVNRY